MTKPAHNRKLTTDEIIDLHKRYLDGESRRSLAKDAGVSESCLSRSFKRCGLEAKTEEAIRRDRALAIKETNQDRYGHSNYMKTEEGRKKISEAAKTLDWEKINAKRKETNLRKYGVENPSQSDEVKQRKKETTRLNYGVDVPLQSEEIKNKLRETKWEIRLQRLLPRLTELGYTLLDEYRGNRIYDDDHKHVNYRQYNIKHECGTIFKDDLFEFPRCPKCYPLNESTAQIDYFNFISQLIPEHEVIKGDTATIVNTTGKNLELDIYIPSLKIAFEYNGAYYHSALAKDKGYHSLKTSLCLAKGIKLYHIWEFDSPQIVRSRIQSILGLTNKVGARQLDFCAVPIVEANAFVAANHLHGLCQSSYAFGLKLKGVLVSVITFRKTDDPMVLEIARFCTKLGMSVQGGFQKLFSNALKELPTQTILSYADRDWTPDPASAVYAKAGFSYMGDVGSILRYVNLSKLTVHSRVTFQKYKLKKLFPETYREEMTGQEILKQNNIVPVYNAGNHKFLFNQWEAKNGPVPSKSEIKSQAAKAGKKKS